MEVRAGFPFNYDADAASVESGLACADESLAVQSQKEEADINVIVRRFGVTGELPQGLKVPRYGDFIDTVTDYRTALDLVMEADKAFMALPAEVRQRFGNDPGKFLDFVEDPANLEELRKMGLAVPKEDTDGSVQSSGESGRNRSQADHRSASSGGGAREAVRVRERESGVGVREGDARESSSARRRSERSDEVD